MPRRKKLPAIPDYEGIARHSENMLVQKSNPLQSLSETKMTLTEFKILDAYLSRINSHKPDERYVRFEKGELEKLLGVSQIKKEDLSQRLDNLFQVVTIRDESKPRKFTKIALFEKAEAFQDENGMWQVDLVCTPSAMEYIFNIENIGYLRYRLKNVIDLTSRYSYILYLYLENNRFRKSWSVSLDEIKTLLNCTADTYTEYKRFNDLILKKCHKELTKKTTLRYSYEPVRTGRKVTAVRFTLEPNTDLLVANNMPQEDESESNSNQSEADKPSQNDETPSGNTEESYKSEDNKFLAGACKYEFNDTQMQELIEMIITIPRSYLPNGDFCDDILVSRYHYLAQKYAALNTYAEKQKIKNRFAYLKKIIKNDSENIISKESENNENYILSDFA